MENKSTRFLIVDDDPSSRRLWEAAIRHLVKDVRVSSLASADTLLSDGQLRAEIETDYDVIVSDIFLSGDVTGVEFVNSLTPRLQKKTILCSGVEVPRFIEIREQMGLKCVFVQKPLSPTLMRCALQRVLEGQIPSAEALGIPLKIVHDGRPIILVTGCSSGIGLELAQRLIAVPSYRVVLTARPTSIEGLRAKFQESDRLMIATLDLRDLGMIRETVARVIEKWGRVDVVVNNAGTCFRSVVEHMDLDSELEQMQTNYLGPLALIRHVLPSMRERGRGKIINVSSVAGSIGMPTMASYSASKHALEGASEALWYEVRPLGINVSVVRPGFVNSEGFRHVMTPMKASLAGSLKGPYSDFYRFMHELISWCMRRSPSTSSSVADHVMRIIKTQNPPLWVDATVDAVLFQFLRRLLPANWFHRFISRGIRVISPLGREYSRANWRRLRA